MELAVSSGSSVSLGHNGAVIYSNQAIQTRRPELQNHRRSKTIFAAHDGWRTALALGQPLRRQTQDVALGKSPDFSLADARVKYSEARKLLISGVNPIAMRLAEKTVEQASGTQRCRVRPLELSLQAVTNSSRYD